MVLFGGRWGCAPPCPFCAYTIRAYAGAACPRAHFARMRYASTLGAACPRPTCLSGATRPRAPRQGRAAALAPPARASPFEPKFDAFLCHYATVHAAWLGKLERERFALPHPPPLPPATYLPFPFCAPLALRASARCGSVVGESGSGFPTRGPGERSLLHRLGFPIDKIVHHRHIVGGAVVGAERGRAIGDAHLVHHRLGEGHA